MHRFKGCPSRASVSPPQQVIAERRSRGGQAFSVSHLTAGFASGPHELSQKPVTPVLSTCLSFSWSGQWATQPISGRRAPFDVYHLLKCCPKRWSVDLKGERRRSKVGRKEVSVDFWALEAVTPERQCQWWLRISLAAAPGSELTRCQIDSSCSSARLLKSQKEDERGPHPCCVDSSPSAAAVGLAGGKTSLSIPTFPSGQITCGPRAQRLQPSVLNSISKKMKIYSSQGPGRSESGLSLP